MYGFPKDWSPLAMEINTLDADQAAGAKVPTTWAQLRTTAQTMASSKRCRTASRSALPADWARMLAFIFQNKGSLANVQSPAVTQAVNFYVGLIKSGLATTPDKLGAGWCGEALGKQTAAIIFEGNWVLPYMKSTFSQVQIRRLPDGQGQDRRQPRVHGVLLDGEGREEQAGGLDAAQLADGQGGQELWISKGLALPSRSDLKAIGRAESVPRRGAVRPRLGLPQLLGHVHDHEQRPAGGDRRQQDDRRRCWPNVAASLKKLGSIVRPPSVRHEPHGRRPTSLG